MRLHARLHLLRPLRRVNNTKVEHKSNNNNINNNNTPNKTHTSNSDEEESQNVREEFSEIS